MASGGTHSKGAFGDAGPCVFLKFKFIFTKNLFFLCFDALILKIIF
jgi:hypothetical protein